VAADTVKTIRIKWVRSGIGFTYHQKTIVRSLGLTKLNHAVVRPDTPQIRGILAAVPHLLQIVPEPVPPAWALIPEYTVQPAVVAPDDSTPLTPTEAASETIVAQAEVPEVTSPDAAQEQESAPEGTELPEASKE